MLIIRSNVVNTSSDPQVIMTFRKYIRKLVALKIISVTWLNPTVAKKGRQMEIFFTDIDPRQLAAYLEKQFKEADSVSSRYA